MKISLKTATQFTRIQCWGWHNLTPLDKSVALTQIANAGYVATLATSLMESDRDSPQALEFLAGRFVEAARDLLEEYDYFCQITESREYAALSSELECIVCVAMMLAENIIDYSHERLMSICRLIVLTPC